MSRISRKQAEIILHLLSYGEIRLFEGGFFNDKQERVNFNSLNGLLTRGLLRVSATKTLPSSGHMASPIFYDTAVTEKGREAFKWFMSNKLEWNLRTPWRKQAVALEEECLDV